LNPRSVDSIKKQEQLVPRPGRNRASFDGKETSLGGEYTGILKNSMKKGITLDLSEFEKVKNLSAFLTDEELASRKVELNDAKNKTVTDAKTRRVCTLFINTQAKMEEYDQKRSSNAKLSELEQEARAKADYLLAKANMQLEEQEDDIKHLNELMLYAKCVAIRDIQVDEKTMIKQEKRKEEARLDHMMEADRVADLKRLAEREKVRIEGMKKGAGKIRIQIEERREAALLQQERRDQETKMILTQIREKNEAHQREKEEKVVKSKKLMSEVAKANNESMERKRQAKIAEEDEDKKVLQYILDKESREKAKDAEAIVKLAEREKDLTRLRAAQEKVSDKQAQQDALRAQRAHETYEREWRKKERGAAEKSMHMEKDLRNERIKQQDARDRAVAIESHKMKTEFFKNVEKHREIEEKNKQEEATRFTKNKLYSQDVKAQIAEKELTKRKDREEFFMEGIRLAKERKEKLDKIEQIKARKIGVSF
jgi:hypothetical protein